MGAGPDRLPAYSLMSQGKEGTTMAYKTTRPLTLRAWDHRGMQGESAGNFTLPAGSRATLVKGLSGTTGDGFAAADVKQIAQLTGNAHDAKYRWLALPADAIEADSEHDKAELARILAKDAAR